MERVAIYIDGSNFYYYCKELNIPSFPQFNFETFTNFLILNNYLVTKNYYIGGIRAHHQDKKSFKMLSKQMSFFAYLKRNKSLSEVVIKNKNYCERGNHNK